MTQHITHITGDYGPLDQALAQMGASRILVVCGASLAQTALGRHFDQLAADGTFEIVRFQDFKPNPLYDSVVRGIDLLHRTGCQAIVGAGGGSAMDVAKCIKLWANEDLSQPPIGRPVEANALPLMLIPTTAGTGSERTRYAVVYYEEKKQSITHDSILPGWVVYDPSALEGLPLYQRHATMMDALCHATESFWSVHSTEESKDYARRAIAAIRKNRDGYLAGDSQATAAMLEAAALAGQAINITQTTAGHAMCYRLCALSGISHGHAAALCVAALWPYMLDHLTDFTDPRGAGYLRDTFNDLALAYGAEDRDQGPEAFQALIDEDVLSVPRLGLAAIDDLAQSVNPVRLANNPVRLSEDAIRGLYRHFLHL
jgi:alcohol dehydrogenase class IV